MRLYVEKGGRGSSVALSIDNEAATIGELCDVLGFDAAKGLLVDGHHVAAQSRVVDAPLVDGVTVRAPDDPGESVLVEQRWWIGVTAGPDTGAVHRISGPCVVRVGRGSDSELSVDNDSVSTTHAELRLVDERVEISDLNSRNGTWVDGRAIAEPTSITESQSFRLGSSEIQLRGFSTADRPLASSAEHANAGGRILLNRPPRPSLPTDPAPLSLPDPVEDRAKPKFPIASLIVPLIFAAVMVLVIGDPRFALFALLSPVMVIGNYVSARRKLTGDRKTDATTHAAALEALDEDLRAGIEQERARRLHLGPDVLELRRRVEVPSNRLWERRMTSADALITRIGRGTIPWRPALAKDSPDFDGVAEDVTEVLAQHDDISDIELIADLHLGVLGLHGDGGRARALTRSIAMQIAVNHGPADVRIAVVTTADRVAEWSWLEWLPHSASGDGGPPLVLHGDNARRLADSLLEQLSDQSVNEGSFSPQWLFLVDDIALVHERASALRQILERSDAGIHGVVLADRIDQLPASTVQVLEIDATDGQCRFGRVDDPASDGTGVVDAVSVATATEIARAMARFEDPEVEAVAGGLPEGVSIRDILCQPQGHDVLERWRHSSTDNSLGAPLGIGPGGPLVIDMTVDGPHGLVAGTTGAGKSELLRTMVIGLATEHSPDDLVFVLVDYKGGSAFDVCTSLPHVVGIVTDLDEHLSQRALRSLDAELHHRELVLRDVEAKDIFEYRDMGSPAGPLPRLMVIVDEFATLRAELPDFVSALVGIAQRGRSLGVHMILATQRPSGAVDANIKANTNLRIALRVQDGGDSRDVIDVAKAAELPRTLPGRAYVRRGEGDLTPVQTAYASGPVPSGTGPKLRVTSRSGEALNGSTDSEVSSITNLADYVAACVEAGSQYATPRRPWVDPLPDRLAIDDVDRVLEAQPIESGSVLLGVGDDPDHQRRVPVTWSPTVGHLGVIGALGTGVTTLLRSAAVAVGEADLGRPVWVYASDHGARGLDGLDAFPHVAPVLEADDIARHERLLTMLEQTLDERALQGAASELPLIVVLIDGIAGFVERNGADSGSPNGERLARVFRDGPAMGIVFAVGAASHRDVPRAMRGGFRRTFVLEQNDPNDYMNFNIRPKEVPSFVPGRVVVGEDQTLAQLFDWSQYRTPHDVVCDVPPASIEALTDTFDAADLPAAVVGTGLEIPVGIDNDSREIAVLKVRPGEHVTVAGPAESGRTSALGLIATQLRKGDPKLVLVGVAPPDSALASYGVFDATGSFEEIKDVLEVALNDSRRWVVLVDDAGRVEDEIGPLQTIGKSCPPNVTLIAAIRSSSARGAYGHWTRSVRGSGVGVLLQPDNSVDSELLGVRLPRGERLEEIPGRCYLVQSATAAQCQLALVDLS